MLFLTVASIIATLASSMAQASAQQAAAKQAQANAEYNAQVQEGAADEEAAQRAIEATSERKQSIRQLASMEARFAKSGLLMAGTPTLMISEQAKADEFNILTRDRASAIRTSNLRTEADLLRMQGADARRAGRTAATTSILGGVASAASIGASYGSRVGGKVDPASGGLLDTNPMAASKSSSLYSTNNRMLA